MEMQDGWRWCGRCSALAYGGFGAGVCAGGQGHDFGASGEYLVPFGAPPEGVQPDWRWCNRCQCLVYAGFGLGTCHAGGAHDHGGSIDYGVPMATVPAGAQEGWRWCSTCQTMVFDGGPLVGTCPGGVDHELAGSGPYAMPTPASRVADVDPVVRVSDREWIDVDGEGYTPGGPVHIRFLVTPRQLDVDTTADGAGRVAWSEEGRRVPEGACLIFVRDESTGRWALGRTVLYHPRRLPLDPVLIDHVVAEPADE
jgi:hypothetical protein